MKRYLSLWSIFILCILTVLCFSGCNRIKKDSDVSKLEQFTFEEESAGITITGYDGSAKTIEIPDELDGKQVTKIKAMAFYKKRGVLKIIVPDSVKEIEASAFEACVD